MTSLLLASETAMWVTGLSGLSILVLLVALLRINNRRLNVAMLAVLIALLLILGVAEEWI